jgi:DNA-binding PadR family transcriptional regulator
MNFDMKSVFENLNENIRAFGGFNPEQVRQAGLLGDEAIRNLVLRSLKGGAKTGHQLIIEVENASSGRIKPTAGRIYPLLESLLDEGLVSLSTKKDRKLYSLTEAGLKVESNLEFEQPTETSKNGSDWAFPKWVDVRGVIPVAATRLGKVSLEVAQFGTKEQQEQAAAALDDARKRIHEILSEK